MSSFIPHIEVPIGATAPFFEDSSGAEIPGWRTRKDPETLQGEVSAALRKLGASNVYFEVGKFSGKVKRYGYRIHFQYAGGRGRYDCAALPMRKETDNKKRQALSQALFLIRNKFEAMALAHVYEPDAMPLVPYLIGASGQTVTEALRAGGMLPMLGNGAK